MPDMNLSNNFEKVKNLKNMQQTKRGCVMGLQELLPEFLEQAKKTEGTWRVFYLGPLLNYIDPEEDLIFIHHLPDGGFEISITDEQLKEKERIILYPYEHIKLQERMQQKKPRRGRKEAKNKGKPLHRR